MTKEEVVRGCVALIKSKAEELNLDVEDKGTGHAFDGMFWDGIFSDTSDIPNIVARNENYSIELRSFWGSPEIDIREKTTHGEILLVFNYSDYCQKQHTGNFLLEELRIDSEGVRGNPWQYVDRLKEMTEFIEVHKYDT